MTNATFNTWTQTSKLRSLIEWDKLMKMPKRAKPGLARVGFLTRRLKGEADGK